ncbi:MAG: Omp28-related outer membrane protein [Taibaiella sp.]|jgi:hypothetical protein
MKKTFIYTASALLLFAASCKENVIPVDMTEGTEFKDSTYVDAVEPAQDRRLLIEELSGVICVNCPQGAVILENLSTQNPNLLSIVTIHTGQFTDPIPGKSKQDFRTEDGEKLQSQVWNGQGSKPSAVFDRLFLGSGQNKYFLDGYPGWANAVVQDKAAHPTTPLNLSVESAYNESKSQYDIEVTVKYTEATTGKQALHIFVTESKIIDAQELTDHSFKLDYEFNHVFRKAITPVATGRTILSDMVSETKEAGRVYVYKTSLKINADDAKEKFWVPANMKVVAFVTDMDAADKHVMHVQETNLQ